MIRRLAGKSPAVLGLAAFFLLFAQSSNGQETSGTPGNGCANCPSAGCGGAACSTGHCQRFHCPPFLKWCMEGPPKICFQHGCPKPVCCPCEAPAWGYYQKCWTPWPWPPEWSHCPVPPPASQVFPGMMTGNQGSLPEEVGPAPRHLPTR